MKHTLGNWIIYNDGLEGSDIVQAVMGKSNPEKYDICEMSMERPAKERKANAKLIARAPKMLQALKEALVWCEQDVANEDSYPTEGMMENRVEVLRQALRFVE